MAGTIVVDRIESDASYASTINVAGQITFSNTVNFGAYSGTAPVAGFYLPTTNNLAFTTASTERMRIDSSGRVGIGYTPSGSDGLFTVNVNSIGWYLGYGANYDNYYTAGTSGIQVFRNGNTERMRIASNGNIDIGGAADAGNTLRYFDVYNTNTGASAGSIIRLITSNVAGSGSISVDIVKYKNGQFSINNNETNSAAFTSFNVGATERMRIDSGGVVALNTASGTPRFEVISIADSNNQGVRLQGSGDTTIQHLSATSNTLNFQQYYSSAWRTAAQIVGNSTADFKFNSGYGSAATAYGCRAWVNFNGTGTVAIRSSGNVSSITDGGVGIYRVNFSTGMPDVNYSTTASVAGGGTVNSSTCAMLVNATSAAAAGQTSSVSYVDVFCYHPGNQVAQDNAWISVTVQR